MLPEDETKNETHDGRVQAAGLVTHSFHEKCASKDSTDIALNVFYYRGWINDRIDVWWTEGE